MANGGRIGGRNIPGVDGSGGIWTPNEIADMRRKFYDIVAKSLGPTALYLMEEGSGTQMTDFSGNGNHGAYQNGALPSSSGLFAGSTKSLNATSNLYATAPGAVASAVSGFSIVAWLQWSHASNLVVLERNQNNGYSIQTSSGGGIQVTSWNGGPFAYLTTPALNDGAPHCVVFSFGATAAASFIYVDGADVTSRPGGNASPSYGATTIWDIGSRAGTLAMSGRLDGVMFVGSQLTLAQAKLLNDGGRLLWP